MINFIKRLILLFTYGSELEVVLKQIKDAKEEEKRRNSMYRLNLCYRHRQESNHSHYSEHNCDYCKIQKKLAEKDK